MDSNQIANTRPPLQLTDPFRASIDALLVVAFARSNSKNYAFAVSVAETADQYAIIPIGGKPMHVVAFGMNPADAGRAVVLLNFTATWKGTLIFSRGKMVQSGYLIMPVLECYMQSCSCRDTKAHCQSVIDDPHLERPQNISMAFTIRLSDAPRLKRNIEIDQYAFPCKFLSRYFRLERYHLSSPQDQIQAAGVQHGCDICPNFDPDQFRKVGVKIAQEDVFE